MEPDRPIDPPSLLVLTPGGHETQYILQLSEIHLGRDAHCTVPLARRGVSRRHAMICIDDCKATVRDLGSTNGTLLNGKPLGEDPEPLSDGDCLTISKIEIRYIEPAARSGEEVERDDSLVTQMGTVLAAGTLGTMLADSPSLLDSPEAEAAVLRVVLSRPAGARLIVREREVTREILLEPGEIIVGRGSDCALRLLDDRASSRHAVIRLRDGQVVLEDLDSRNGTRVNGAPINEHRLADDDLIRIGDVTLQFRDVPREEPGKLSRGTSRRPVVIVPGFAASELWNGEVRIWPNLPRLMSSSEKQLMDDWREPRVGHVVRETSIIPGFSKGDSFAWLLEYLTDDLGYEVGADVLEFSYDWRLDNRETARRFSETVRKWREGSERPTEKITVIAHSMGGLVTRLFLSVYGGSDAVERVIFVGTPHLGSVNSLRMCIAGTGALPFGIALRKVQKLVMEFPSFYQLFPVFGAAELEDGKPFMPFEERPDWLDPRYREHFETAAAFRELVDAQPINAPVPATCIFGYKQKTPEGLRLKRKRSGELIHLDSWSSRNGDGSVLEKSAVLADCEIHPVVQQHGALYSDPDVLRRIRFELIERE